MKRREPENFRCSCGRVAFCLEANTNEPVCKELLLSRAGRAHIWKIDNRDMRHIEIEIRKEAE